MGSESSLKEILMTKELLDNSGVLSIIHVDMDAFYASIEQRDNPYYRGKPVIVGGSPDGRGVVSTASYEAREFGIHSAMPAARAKNLCPFAIFIPTNMQKYKAVSRQVHAIFRRYTKIIEPISIDEAFLDIREGNAVKVGQAIKLDIERELKLTASVGVSYNKFLAKLASDMEKPNGFTVITPEYAKELLPSLPVRKLWGVGKKTENELNQLGIFTVADLINYDRKFLIERWGRRGYELLKFAHGIDESQVETRQEAKSMGEETTLKQNTQDIKELASYLEDFSKSIADRLKAENLKCRTITIKVKYEDFKLITRSKTFKKAIFSHEQLYSIGKNILSHRISLEKPVRLIGMQVSNFVQPYEPMQLTFEDIIDDV